VTDTAKARDALAAASEAGRPPTDQASLLDTAQRDRSYHQARGEAPAAPPGCPLHSSWSPLDEDYLADPYPIAAALRDDLGVFYAESLGYLVVTEMTEIERIFTDHETFASVNVQDPVFDLAPEAQAVLAAEDFDPVAVMSNRPEPEHGRIRVHTRAGFSNRRIKNWRYCRDFVAAKNADRGDDFTSELLDAHEADPDDLSYREVESVVYGLSFAGHEAVTALICNTLQCLLPARDVWEEVCADPTLIPNAVEEVLRFNSSQVSWRRITTRDTTVGDYEVPAGTSIFLNFASANRQPDLWEAPDSFDIHRPNANRHISFGKGVHYCLGARFAKTETQLVIEALAERIPSLRLLPGQRFDYFPNITFRGPTQLHVAWD